MNFARILCTLGALVGPAVGGELDFVQVDRIPTPQGAAQPTETVHARGDVWAERTIYVEELGDALVLSHSVQAGCGSILPIGRRGPAMLAVQIVPKQPVTAQAADLRNRYLVAYVEDERGAVRRYDDLTVLDLTAITNRFLPRCTML